MKIEGSRSASASASVSQRNGSADPDPHQNVMDPQHWLPPPVPPCRGRYLGGGGKGGAATDLLQLVGEALLAGELVLLQGEQQLLVVLHRVPAQQQQFSEFKGPVLRDEERTETSCIRYALVANSTHSVILFLN
jgi:hypothetical protein